MDEGPWVGPGLAGGTTYPVRSRSASGSPRRSWRALPVRRRSGAPTSDKQKKMDGWFIDSLVYLSGINA